MGRLQPPPFSLPPEKLKRIDLTSNSISWADADAFRLLPSLQELILPENRLTALPELPRSIVRLDARLNRIPSTGLQPEAFRVGAGAGSGHRAVPGSHSPNQAGFSPKLPRQGVVGMVPRVRAWLEGGSFTSCLFPQDLKQLQFLHLSDNQLDYVPTPLPESLRSLHLQVRHGPSPAPNPHRFGGWMRSPLHHPAFPFQNNNIQTMHKDTFCDSQDHSHIRRALEDIRLDGNPINLSLFPNAYFCLPRLPTGRFA